MLNYQRVPSFFAQSIEAVRISVSDPKDPKPRWSFQEAPLDGPVEDVTPPSPSPGAWDGFWDAN